MTTGKTTYKKAPLVILLVLLCAGAWAQRKKHNGNNNDTLALYRECMQINNLYQQLPLYLKVELNNTTNYVTGEEDTAHMQAEFYLKPGLSYVRFNEAEQLVNDSMALLVSDKLQRMVLYTHAQPDIKNIQAITGMQWRDSSLQQMAGRFAATTATSGGVRVIYFTGRNQVPGTSLPKESVEFQFDAATNVPVKVITCKRMLLPVTEEDYAILAEAPKLAGKLITLEGRGHFLVKEQTGTFEYKQVSHSETMAIPVTMADRVVKNEQGEYIPVKTYQHYAITLN